MIGILKYLRLEQLASLQEQLTMSAKDFDEAQTKAHDRGYQQAIDEYKELVLSEFCEGCDQEACNGAMIGSTQECYTVCRLRDTLNDIQERLKEKEQKND